MPLDGYREPAIVSAPDQPAETAPDLERLKKMFEEAFDLTADARREATVDIDYYDSKQWTSAERAALAARKQPDLVINRIKPAINGILGVVEQGKSEPRAYPRTPKDEDSADVATDTLRYIADFNRFHRIKQACFRDMLVPGSMAAIIGADQDKQITVTQVRWEEFFADPRSRRDDYKDARYLGIAKWMYADDLAGMYPDKREEIESAADSGQGGLRGDSTTGNDRPEGVAKVWNDRRTRRIRVVELYHREAGAWQRCIFHGHGLLEYGPSPYTDDKGRPDCPIEAQSAYVDRENARYGLVRDMRGPQDEINKRRSKLLHLISVSQIQAVDPSAVEVNPDTARAEAARPDGVIPFGWQKVSTADIATGQAMLLQEAKGEIERLGPNPAVVGRDNADASGRALQQRTQAGMIELALIYGGLNDWELRVYRQCWSRARQYWTDTQYIRVTDDEDAPRFVGLNVPKGAPVMDPETGEPAFDPETGEPVEGEPVLDANGQPVFGYKNVLAQMDVDIILDTTQDTATIQQEQFEDLMQLIGANPMYAQQVPFDVVLKLSRIPHKRELADMLKKAAEGMAQVQAEAAEAAKAKSVSEIRKTESETALNEARAVTEQSKPMVEAARLYQQAQQPPPGSTGATEQLPAA